MRSVNLSLLSSVFASMKLPAACRIPSSHADSMASVRLLPSPSASRTIYLLLSAENAGDTRRVKRINVMSERVKLRCGENAPPPSRTNYVFFHGYNLL